MTGRNNQAEMTIILKNNKIFVKKALLSIETVKKYYRIPLLQ